MHPRARQLIERLGLDAHPEGGFYRRLFVASQRDAQGRAASSAILFLLPGGVVSRWHQVDADELWHFHEGEQLPQRAVPAHAWQAARSTGPYTLVGCSVAPEFQFAGFRLLADDPQAQAQWPQLVVEYPELL